MKELQLLWVYNSRLEPGTIVKNHAHSYYHMLSIVDGQMELALGNQIYNLEQGDTILVPKGAIHRFSNHTEQPLHYYQLNFTVLNRSLEQTVDSEETCVLQDPFVAEMISRIWQEYQEGRLLKDEFAESALKMLLLRLTEQFRSSQRTESEVIDTTGCTALAKRVIDYLTEHYDRELTLDDVSAGVNITKHYLCNAFKQSTGTTINGCLNMIRIRKAAELIVYSDLPLPQVAQMCGYVSVSHFNRVFMRYVGIPPGQCRRAFSFDNLTNARRSPGTFMYSVLANKSITPDIINEFERKKKEEKE